MGRNLRQEYLDSGRAGAYGNGMGRNLRQDTPYPRDNEGMNRGPDM